MRHKIECELIGQLTKDPEIRYSQNSGLAFATFKCIVENAVKGKTYNTWADIVVFGDLAEDRSAQLKAGDTVRAIGRPEANAYISKKDDKPKGALKIIAHTLYLAGDEKDTAPIKKPSKPAESTDDQSQTDDLPF